MVVQVLGAGDADVMLEPVGQKMFLMLRRSSYNCFELIGCNSWIKMRYSTLFYSQGNES